MRVWLAAPALALLFATACGDEAPSSESLCHDFVDVYCNMASECFPEEYRSRYASECKTSVVRLDCTRVVAVAPSYNTCLSDMQSAHCQYVFDPALGPGVPNSCSQLFTTR